MYIYSKEWVLSCLRWNSHSHKGSHTTLEAIAIREIWFGLLRDRKGKFIWEPLMILFNDIQQIVSSTHSVNSIRLSNKSEPEETVSIFMGLKIMLVFFFFLQIMRQWSNMYFISNNLYKQNWIRLLKGISRKDTLGQRAEQSLWGSFNWDIQRGEKSVDGMDILRKRSSPFT